MTVILTGAALIFGGVYNGIVAYELYQARNRWWKVLASAATAVGLAVFGFFKLVS